MIRSKIIQFLFLLIIVGVLGQSNQICTLYYALPDYQVLFNSEPIPRAEDVTICEQYRSNTCCSTMYAGLIQVKLDPLGTQIQTYLDLNKVSESCLEKINELRCLPCSGEQGIWMIQSPINGKTDVYICHSFCESFFSSCLNENLTDSTGISDSQLVSERFASADDFCRKSFSFADTSNFLWNIQIAEKDSPLCFQTHFNDEGVFLYCSYLKLFDNQTSVASGCAVFNFTSCNRVVSNVYINQNKAFSKESDFIIPDSPLEYHCFSQSFRNPSFGLAESCNICLMLDADEEHYCSYFKYNCGDSSVVESQKECFKKEISLVNCTTSSTFSSSSTSTEEVTDFSSRIVDIENVQAVYSVAEVQKKQKIVESHATFAILVLSVLAILVGLTLMYLDRKSALTNPSENIETLENVN